MRGKRRARNALVCFGLVLLQDLGIGVGVFYLAWGLNYARPPLEMRQGWEEVPAPEMVERLAVHHLHAANDLYVELHGAEDAGEPTGRRLEPEALDEVLAEGWLRTGTMLGLGGPGTWRRGPPKHLLISPLLRRMGLSGFYSPFTGEANVVSTLPGVSYPQVVAHEQAHQRGIAPEDEANFFGFLVAWNAPDPWVRYSASIFAQRQALRALLRLDPDRAEELLALRHPGVQRDVDDLYEYWSVAQGAAAKVSRSVNDAYLKTNRVEGGVQAYGRSLELILRAAANGDFGAMGLEASPRPPAAANPGADAPSG